MSSLFGIGANGAASFYNSVATQSLRFDDGSSAYLSRTFSGNVDNDKKMTISVWVKRGIISNATQVIIGNYDATRFLGELSWRSDDKIVFRPGGLGDGSSNSYSVQTTAQFRDVSSWYHIVLAYDTTQSTDTNRVKMYVNGTQRTLEALSGSHSFPPQNYAHDFSYAGANNAIGYYPGGFNSNYLDGYLSEFNFIDGLTLDPTYFGETKNGVWIAKEYQGSYGTNGYRLEFKNTSVGSGSSSTIGADTSGNDNHWTSSGIVASDCNMPDSPENNFATVNPLSSGAGVFSEGNLKYVSTADTGNTTFGISSGKVYAEVYVSSVSNSYIGVIDIRNLSPTRGGDWTSHGGIAYKQDGNQYSLPVGGSSATASYGASYTNGDIIGIALNVDDDTITFYKNGSSQSATTNGVSHISSNGVYGFLLYASGTNFICNFGQDSSFAGNKTAQGNTDGNGIGDFYYAPPSGYLALCSANLLEPTISPNSATQADDYFNTVLYTGNGSTQSITGVGFQPDWVWIKSRSGAANHGLHDSSRVISGNEAILNSNTTSAESTGAAYLSSFDSDGFTVNNNSSGNNSSDTYVAWNWKAGGTASSNTDGSVTSSVSANTTAGFSIVSYTGTDSATETIGHGLGAVPAMLIIKSRDSALNWAVYHKGSDATAPEDYLLRLNTTDARADVSSSWNDTAPTSSVFTVGTSSLVNNTDDFIAYCFAEIEGFSKFGSYTGNGSANGTFVYTGFRPAWIIIKRTDAAEDWWIYDNKRNGFNPHTQIIYANANSAELTGTGDNISNDFVSNGIKLRTANVNWNASGGTYIYMAFAEAPFKYANAR